MATLCSWDRDDTASATENVYCLTLSSKAAHPAPDDTADTGDRVTLWVLLGIKEGDGKPVRLCLGVHTCSVNGNDFFPLLLEYIPLMKFLVILSLHSYNKCNVIVLYLVILFANI